MGKSVFLMMAEPVVEGILGEFGFRLIWVSDRAHAEVKVYEIVGRNGIGDAPIFDTRDCAGSEDIGLAETYLTASLKWDGCCHFHFGGEGNGAGYIHLCGRGTFTKHVLLMDHIWRRAPGIMGLTVEQMRDYGDVSDLWVDAP